MKTSLIIPTYNGAHKIVHLLDSLKELTIMPDEIIVVVDGSTDNTIEILQPYRSCFNNFNIIVQKNQGRAVVRNNGALNAKNELLVFCDDDMIVPKTWIEAHKEHHVNYPNSICVGELKGVDSTTNTDFYKFRLWLHKKWTQNFEISQKDIILLEQPYIAATNFSIRKSIFNELGGFDKRLTDGEDFDLATRAKIKKIPIYHNKNAVIINNDEDNITCSTMIKRLRQYNTAYNLLHELKPDLYPPKNTNKLSIFKKIIYFVFSNKFWINSIDKEIWTFLPPTIRYKLYDIVITSNSSVFLNKVNL
jgi:glycosyltransferase involved in cell wall biosynthesis